MKKLVIILFLLGNGNSKAQNLVPNPGFEILDSICPVSYFISYSYLWETATWGTPDVFDTCAGIPQNNGGYQFAHTGKGMGGISTRGPNNYREYLEIKLDSPLMDAHDYCVEFWMSMGEYSQLATYPPQVYFSDTQIYSPTNNPLYFTPQFIDTTVMITDTASWVLVSGTFSSLCNCQYMLIGNFFDDANTDTLQIQPSYLSAYYYIDDISVTDCTPTNVKKLSGDELALYPIPAHDEILVKGWKGRDKTISVLNTIGQTVLTKRVWSEEEHVDIRLIVPGVYYMKVEGDGEIQILRFVKE